jgi:hypothetical protein
MFGTPQMVCSTRRIGFCRVGMYRLVNYLYKDNYCLMFEVCNVLWHVLKVLPFLGI